MFREHEGFTVTTDDGLRRPKGVPRRKGMKADRLTIRGDLTNDGKFEAAIWLSPRFRGRTH